MKYAFKWITEAAQKHSISYSLLNEDETQALLLIIENRFLFPADGKPIWERIKNPYSKRSGKAWELACEIVGDRFCHLIVEQLGMTRIFRFLGMPDLKTVLGECPAFEFSACGMDAEYLLAVNHHDYLLASGSAIDLLKCM